MMLAQKQSLNLQAADCFCFWCRHCYARRPPAVHGLPMPSSTGSACPLAGCTTCTKLCLSPCACCGCTCHAQSTCSSTRRWFRSQTCMTTQLLPTWHMSSGGLCAPGQLTAPLHPAAACCQLPPLEQQQHYCTSQLAVTMLVGDTCEVPRCRKHSFLLPACGLLCLASPLSV